ncbi:hypothetical protein [Streptomyces humi]|nr:hypothetical protein [Streptomyces humi]
MAETLAFFEFVVGEIALLTESLRVRRDELFGGTGAPGETPRQGRG